MDQNYPDFEDYDLSYTKQEIADAPKTRITISSQNSKASAGDFAVDFGSINDTGDDVLIIRELPIHDFKSDGYAVHGYDLALESGKDSFAGEVCIQIPRYEEDGDLVEFVTIDPETGKNKREFFEISEDGKHYLLYTTHFSGHNKVTKAGFGEMLRQSLKEGDLSNKMVRDSLNAFFYTEEEYDPEDILNCKVYYNPVDMWRRLNKTTKSVSADALLETVTKKAQEELQNPQTKKEDMSGPVFSLLFGNDTAEKVSEVYGGASNIKDTVKGTINPDSVKATLTDISWAGATQNIKDTIKTGKGINLLDTAGAAATIYNFGYATRKAINEVAAGKYKDASSAAWGHWADIAAMGAGVAGMTGAVIGSAPVTVVAALAGLGLFAYSKCIETPYDDMDETELNYRTYFFYRYNKGNWLDSEYTTIGRTFDYDEPESADFQLKEGVNKGNVRRLECLDEKQNKMLKRYLSEHSSWLPIAGQDIRDKTTKPDSNWLRTFRGIYYTVKKNPELLNKAILEFIQNYCESCSPFIKKNGISKADYLEFSRNAMRLRGSDPDAARLPLEDEMKAYTERMEKELLVYLQPVFEEFAEELSHEAELEVDLMIEKELVPLLNTQMVFTVEDTSLSDPTNFKQSVYNGEPVKIDKKKKLNYSSSEGTWDDIRLVFEPYMEFYIRDENDNPVGAPLFKPAVGYYEYDRRYDDNAIKNTLYSATILKKADDDIYFPHKDNFWPKLMSGNTVFCCTFYHYLMMGAPNAISFYDPESDADDIIVDLFEDGKIPEADSKGVIRINVKVEPNDSKDTKLTDFIGTYSFAGEIEDGLNAYIKAFIIEDEKHPGDIKIGISFFDTEESMAKQDSYNFRTMPGLSLSTNEWYQKDHEVKVIDYKLEGNTLYRYEGSLAPSGSGREGNSYFVLIKNGDSLTLKWTDTVMEVDHTAVLKKVK